MALHHSPRIVTDGLVFCYDMGNTEKSFRGKPTTNFISNPTTEIARGEFGQYYDLAPVFDTYGLIPYSLSMDIKVNKAGTVLVYMQNGSSTKYQFVYSGVNATTEYQRFYFNNLTPSLSTPSDTAAWLAIYTTYGSGVNPTIRNIQLETGTFATPFVSGTRTATQSVLDLTRNNIITVTSLTYNSDGTFSFDGSLSRIDTGSYFPNVFTGTNNFTIECWVNPGTSQPSYADIWGHHTEPYKGLVMQQNASTSNQFSWGFGAGTYWSNNSGLFNLTASVWNHVVAVRNGSTLSAYVNGAFVTSGTDSGSLSSNTSFNFQFGTGYNLGSGRNFNGKISIGKIYNKALSASEILQNYNAMKVRFGL